jgi:membrane-associated phospholipid phosphatase
MRALEWVVLPYAATFGLVALIGQRASRAATAAVLAALTIASALLVPHLPEAIGLIVPGLYLVAGYWLPGLVVPKHALARTSRFERWLAETDTRLRPRLPSIPQSLVALAEAAYLFCYPVVPLSLAIVWWYGGADAVPRFWLTVLVAGFACYGSLPWLLSRPPDRSGLRPLRVRTLNRSVLATVSHQWTTFPSGHVAVSWAAALAVARVSVGGGALLSLVALGVSTGAAAGRYHYVVDVLLGLIVGLAAVMVT